MYEAAISVVPSLLWTPHSYQVCTTLVLFMQGYCATISAILLLVQRRGQAMFPMLWLLQNQVLCMGGQPCHDQYQSKIIC